jgi:hypothetical protein
MDGWPLIHRRMMAAITLVACSLQYFARGGPALAITRAGDGES